MLRPYHLTYEILDRNSITNGKELRIVPALELNADALLEESAKDGEDMGTPEDDETEGAKTNEHIFDKTTNQSLSMAEIEALKKDTSGTGQEIVAKLLASHTTLGQKTAFSLAKYTARKKQKYLKRFTVLPLDVHTMVEWMMADRDFGKIMEIRAETIGLMNCWANAHATGTELELGSSSRKGRYLVVDDTAGLIVAAVAESMSLLHQEADAPAQSGEEDPPADGAHHLKGQPRKLHPEEVAMRATSNTITMIHSNTQPNLSLLKYFGFNYNMPCPSHPLHAHLKTLSWLQLLEPSSDPVLTEPEFLSPEVFSQLKASKRSAYHRKRRRWQRISHIVDETQTGNFDGLIVATHTDPIQILHHLVPLLAGSAQVVVYNPHIEPLAKLTDLYSTGRRTAYINTDSEIRKVPSEDFPVDPTLLLPPMVQTARVRKWQVLPGRTHPIMTSRGGAEGYLFVATRVLPAEGKVEARGRASKKRKVVAELSANESRLMPEVKIEADLKVEEPELITKVKTEPLSSPSRDMDYAPRAFHGNGEVNQESPLYQ